jgi:putative transposase
VTERFEFIDAEYAAYLESADMHAPSVVKMCRWMKVSRSGFYEWRNAPESATARRRGIIAVAVQRSFDGSDGTYGYRRVHADLAAWGVPAGPELVRSVMRELGLEPCQPRPWRFSLTEGDGQEHAIPDLVERDFTAGAPGEKLVGDITYIPTWQGWLYLLVTWNHRGVSPCDFRDRAVASPQADGGGGRAGDGCGVVWQVAGPGAARAGC